MILQIQSHEDRFTDFLAGILAVVFVITFSCIIAMMIISIWNSARKVAGKSYVVMNSLDPSKWRWVRDAPDQKQDEYTYGKYVHEFLYGDKRVYLARRDVNGLVEFYDEGRWMLVSEQKKHNFVPDKHAGC